MKSRVQSTYNFWKSVQYWEWKLFDFFWPIFYQICFSEPSCFFSNKIPWSIQSSKQRRFTMLINSFPWSHVSYCSFVWMWYDRILHNKIFRLHLQEETFSVSAHNGNLEIPSTECDDSKGITTKIFANICIQRSPVKYSLSLSLDLANIMKDWYFMESKKFFF